MVTDADFESELLEVAVEAARAAGAELLARWRRPLVVSTKSTPTDPVSDADIAAEAAIRDVLGSRRPADAILGEEGGATSGRQESGATGQGELTWVVDPLDGTVNFLYGLPTFAVSVAVRDGEGWLAGVVLDPVRDELFSATRGGDPLVDDEPIAASRCSTLDHALIATGFGYDPEVRALQGEVVARLLPMARDIRRAGAAALDMCWCASGRLDAYFERGVKEWDIAAGTLLCRRAGLAVRTLEPHGKLPSGVLVAPPPIVDELYGLVAS
jgi:myo-inositol-1(or 4)-monophosphatase